MPQALTQAAADGKLDTLHWRNIGPSRGGRVVAVAGDAKNKATFYFGACAGGIWKTEDGGVYWRNVSDGFLNTAAVGAIAVARSDSNVIYAGMGEDKTRADAWAWFKANYATIIQKTPTFGRGGLVGVGGRFCTPAERNDYKRFFDNKVQALTGAPRNYANVLESIDNCIAMAEKQREKANTYFARYKDSKARPSS